MDGPLFGSSSHDASLLTRIPPLPTNRGHRNIRTSRLVLNIGPALAASVTWLTSNFLGLVRKSVITVFTALPNNGHLPLPHPSASTQTNSHTTGVFEGAPHPDDTLDPWVVLPRVPRRVQSVFLTAEPTEMVPPP